MLIVVDQLGRGLSPSRRECGALSVKALSHFSRQSTTDMCQPITIGLPRLRHRAYKEAAIPPWGFADSGPPHRGSRHPKLYDDRGRRPQNPDELVEHSSKPRRFSSRLQASARAPHRNRQGAAVENGFTLEQTLVVRPLTQILLRSQCMLEDTVSSAKRRQRGGRTTPAFLAAE